MQTDICPPMFTVAALRTVKICNQPKCASMNKQRKGGIMYCTHENCLGNRCKVLPSHTHKKIITMLGNGYVH